MTQPHQDRPHPALCLTGFVQSITPTGSIQPSTHRLITADGQLVANLRSGRGDLAKWEGRFATVCGIDEGVVAGARSLIAVQIFPATPPFVLPLQPPPQPPPQLPPQPPSEPSVQLVPALQLSPQPPPQPPPAADGAAPSFAPPATGAASPSLLPMVPLRPDLAALLLLSLLSQPTLSTAAVQDLLALLLRSEAH